MAVPLTQMYRLSKYVLTQRLRGRKRYPLILMLEPLFRCNLACAGCGKIQYPGHILKSQLTPEQCFAAAEECGAPIVSIPGGEPLLHPQIGEIARGLVDRKRFIYLCTNGVLLEEKLDLFEPSPYFSFSVHLDGPRKEHDFAVCRMGVYDTAVKAIRAAVARGFRVTTNTTIFSGADPEKIRSFFDDVMALGVEGMMVAPGYEYPKAPDQERFLKREETRALCRSIFGSPKRSWKFNQSTPFIRFLTGKEDFECSPWGSPTYNVFGWQRPCYLLQEGYCDTFQELIETTDWDAYGSPERNEKCANCLMHCGFEPTAVDRLFTIRGIGQYATTSAASF